MAKHLSHLKSKVVETTTVNGITVSTPKLPTAAQLWEGEIAVNFAKGYERLSIKNDQNEIVSFLNENEIYENERVTSFALNDLNIRLNNVYTNVYTKDDVYTQTEIDETIGSIREDLATIDEVTSSALNDLNERLSETDDSIQNVISEVQTALTTAEKVTASSLNDLNERIESSYEAISDVETDLATVERDTTASLTNLNERINNTYTKTEVDTRFQNLSSETVNLIEVTYAQLVSKKTNSELIPGAWYRITDYATTTTQTNTQSAGHNFDIIVLATDVNVLNENARAIKHTGDTYFADCNLNAWELKYSLENDASKFAWADSTNGKGVIYYMKDEWNNECPYDFKNIQFKRWAVTDVQNNKLDSTTLNGLKEAFVYDDDDSKFITRYSYKNSDIVQGEDTTLVVDANDFDWYYTFSTFKLEDDIFSINEIEDASIKGNNFYNDENGGGCFENSIKPFYDNMASDNGGIDGAQYLNNIVFNGYYETTEYGSVYHCSDNSFGNHNINTTFGYGCLSNTFGVYCSSNTFGNNFANNTFGTDCNNNTFGNMWYNNTFGNMCYSNTFGNECHNNTFGNNCSNNTFRVYCSNNTFGNNCKYIVFQKDYMYNNIVENGNSGIGITVTSTQTTSSSNKLQNIKISQGVNNSTTARTISHNTVNDTFQTVYQNANSTVVNV